MIYSSNKINATISLKIVHQAPVTELQESSESFRKYQSSSGSSNRLQESSENYQETSNRDYESFSSSGTNNRASGYDRELQDAIVTGMGASGIIPVRI